MRIVLTNPALVARLVHEVCNGCKGVTEFCAASMNMSAAVTGVRSAGRRSTAGPVHAASGRSLQNLQTQPGRAAQRRLQPRLTCHHQLQERRLTATKWRI